MTFTLLGPLPFKNVLVMVSAMDVLLRILDTGNHTKFVQFDMFQDSQSLYLTIHFTPVMGVLEGASIGDDPCKKFTLTQCLIHIMWFERFMRGVKLKVGRVSQLNQAI